MDEMSKQGLYFWLRSVVDSGKCPGVTWIDETNGVFQIPWSNQKSRSWQKEDSGVFLEYAKHTCKYKHGDKMDFPKWKQNLKSAINKNRYIVRLRERDNLSGQKPYRVYKFLNEKTERKKSSDDFPYDIKNMAIDFLSAPHISDLELKGRRLAVNNETLLVQKDQSASGAVSVLSDSESRSSRSSPHSTVVQNRFAFSPDIPRSDFCDGLQGNIPTFVNCETDNNLLFRDDSNSSSLPESISVNASLTTPSYTEVESDNEINKHRHSSETNPHKNVLQLLKTQRNDNQRHFSETLIHTKTQEQTPSGIQSHSVPAITDLSEDFVRAMKRSDNTCLAGQGNVLGLNYPFTIPHCAYRDPSLALVNRQNLPQAGPNEPSRKMQQAEQESQCEIISTRAISMANELPTSAIPELEFFGEHSFDVQSSMDTYDVNFQSDHQKFIGDQFTTHRDCEMSETAPKETSTSLATTSITDDSIMHVEVLYGIPHRTVKKFIVTSKRSSCRLFYGAVTTSVMQEAIQGQQDAEEFELPPVDDPGSPRYETNYIVAIGNVLKDMEQGIVITYSNNDIFVERRCLPRVYLSDGLSKSETLPRSTKKRPDVRTLAFDYNKQFKECIELNKQNNNALPKDHFFLTIGYQIIPNDESPTRQVPVYIVVRHVQAARERFRILGASTIAPNPMCSDPNSFDKNVQLFKDLDLKK